MSSSSSSLLTTDHSSSYQSPPHPPPGPGHKTVRRRNRVINSCLECRRRKLKCSRDYPCAACMKHGRKCVFLDTALDSIGLHKLTEIKNRVGSLEDLLETEVAARSQRHSSEDSSIVDHRARSNTDSPPIRTRIKVEDLSGTANLAPNYENDTDDEIADLGVRIGMLRMNERIGGMLRSSITKELEQTFPEDLHHPRPYRFSPPVTPSSPYHSERILPSSNFFTSWISPDAPAANFIPHKTEADLLYFQYFACVDPLNHVVHKPTFDRLYQKFWTDVYRSVQPASSVFALVYAVFFAAVVSLPQNVAQLQFGLSKDALVDKFRISTEYALARANFLKTSKIETMQALTIYLLPQCRSEISRAHSSLVGALIRLAESHSLHRDTPPHNPHPSPLELHTRRLLWHAIIFLDIKTAEIHSPRPTIRPDDYDTKLPLNIDDATFVTSPNPIPTTAWTSATFTLIRFECYNLHRLILTERTKPTLSYQALTDLIREKRNHIENTYLCYLDDRLPIQKACLITATLLLERLTPMSITPYLPLTSQPKHHLIAAATKVINSAILLETSPELAPWAWYAGAYQQFQTVLLLLPEALRSSSPPIERCLDYVFGPCEDAQRRERARGLLGVVMEKMDVFVRIRIGGMMEGERTHLGMAPEPAQVLDPGWTLHGLPQAQEGIEWLGYADYSVHGAGGNGAVGPVGQHEAHHW